MGFLIFLAILVCILGAIHLYLWQRLVRDAITHRRWRRVAGFALLAGPLLILATVLAEPALPRPAAAVLVWPGYLWLGVMFYLLVALVLLELPVLAAWLVQRRMRVDPARRRLLRQGAAVAAGVAAAGISGYGVSRAYRPPKVTRLAVPLARLDPRADGLRVVVIADIHVSPTFGAGQVERVVDVVNGLDADVITVVGDMVSSEVGKVRDAAAPLRRMRSRYGSFFVTGNHEYYNGYEEWIEAADELGLRVLRNQRVEIAHRGGAIDLAGVNDREGAGYDDPPDYEAALGDRDPTRPVLLMAHQPVQVHDAARYGVDLQLSGHTHGGQVYPFDLLVRLQQPVVSGLSEVDGTLVYVTNGAGFWGPPMRVGADPDVTLIELRAAYAVARCGGHAAAGGPVAQCTVPSEDQHHWVADLHIHSKYSMACSRDLDLPNLGWWARRKGIAVLGTGDITHPAWRDHVREQLRPAEPGLFRLSPEVERDIDRRLPPRLAAAPPARFLLSVEISTIYKRDGRTRKVHHLVFLPDLDAAERFAGRLARIGNIASDGRPILGLDSRDLLEIALESGDGAYLVPAHIWTPWFSTLGSKSGFDAVADCYADLADHIFAVETGLSSDPAMNHRVSSLDRYRLISCSDAHSPPTLAREATTLTCELDYFAIREALRTGDGLHGTIEFFPEEGKYHADGHRACDVNWSPAQTRAAGGACPECGKPLTVGVLSRVEDLADRPEDAPPPAHAKHVTHLVQLPQVLGEVLKVGSKSKRVTGKLNELVAALGSELEILTRTPLDEVSRVGGEPLAEAIRRLRRGEVRRTPGYDGEYGVIRLFDPGELDRPVVGSHSQALFDLPAPEPARPTRPTRQAPITQQLTAVPSPHEPMEPVLAGMEEVGTGLLDRLDAMQRVAASAPGGPLLVVAGPGTGKTRTLTHRIAYLCAELGVSPVDCLAITFTRRAADELRSRLAALLGDAADDVTVATFHALGLAILRDNHAAAGLPAGFRVADEADRQAAREQAGEDDDRYRKLLRAADLVDFDELVSLPLAVLRSDPALVTQYRARWPWVFVDEYQDVDADQYALLRLLTRPEGNICAIGDPDQAIYSFRGADVAFFLRFAEDFTDARMVRLTRNYRSAPPIIAAAVQAIAPSTLVRGRRLDPARLRPDAPLLGRYHAGSYAEEAQFVARTTDDLVGGVSHRSLDSGRASGAGDRSFSDIAVLYRTDAQSGPIVDALGRAGIPVQKRSHNRLRDRTGVAEIARELRHAGPGGDLASRVKRAGQLLADRYHAPTLDPADTVKVHPTDVWSAVELLLPLAARCEDDLPRFLAALAAGTEVDALDPRAEAVTLLTLHAAKGLEFPIVFLVGVEDGLLPFSFPGQQLTDAELAEERRLFFVGLSRAEDRLYLSHTARPSRFLSVIDTGLFESLGGAAPARPRHQQPRLL